MLKADLMHACSADLMRLIRFDCGPYILGGTCIHSGTCIQEATLPDHNRVCWDRLRLTVIRDTCLATPRGLRRLRLLRDQEVHHRCLLILNSRGPLASTFADTIMRPLVFYVVPMGWIR